jgi:FtsP/CotA-like multicopper oxidase with cupredoxin domain
MRRGMGRGMMGYQRPALDLARIDVRVPLGSIEVWEVANETPLAHLFHIYGIQFRILDRDGEPSLPHDQGLKDTVLVDPGSAVRVIAQFLGFSDAQHPYMYHCHNLEHEDAGHDGAVPGGVNSRGVTGSARLARARSDMIGQAVNSAACSLSAFQGGLVAR